MKEWIAAIIAPVGILVSLIIVLASLFIALSRNKEVRPITTLEIINTNNISDLSPANFKLENQIRELIVQALVQGWNWRNDGATLEQMLNTYSNKPNQSILKQ